MIVLHHIGCLTENIEQSIISYRAMNFGRPSQVYDISSQKVKVCFLEQANGVYLEFVQPAEDNKTLLRLLSQKKYFYHLGYSCLDFDKSLSALADSDHHLISVFHSEAFDNKRCAFLLNPDGHLIELVETMIPA
jgi:methylmalonyl-CoA/ethylmalonyl-CoA epimerase